MGRTEENINIEAEFIFIKWYFVEAIWLDQCIEGAVWFALLHALCQFLKYFSTGVSSFMKKPSFLVVSNLCGHIFYAWITNKQYGYAFTDLIWQLQMAQGRTNRKSGAIFSHALIGYTIYYTRITIPLCSSWNVFGSLAFVLWCPRHLLSCRNGCHHQHRNHTYLQTSWKDPPLQRLCAVDWWWKGSNCPGYVGPPA